MAAKKPGLRVVAPDEKRERKQHTVASAATDGDRLDLLIAMRDRIAKAITAENCPPRDLASLTRRLDDIAEKIAVLEAADALREIDDDGEDQSFDASAI
jgi:hypothetical protein